MPVFTATATGLANLEISEMQVSCCNISFKQMITSTLRWLLESKMLSERRQNVQFPKAGGELDWMILKVSSHLEDSMMILTHFPGISHLLLCYYYIGKSSHNAEGYLVRAQSETIFKESVSSLD